MRRLRTSIFRLTQCKTVLYQLSYIPVPLDDLPASPARGKTAKT